MLRVIYDRRELYKAYAERQIELMKTFRRNDVLFNVAKKYSVGS